MSDWQEQYPHRRRKKRKKRRRFRRFLKLTAGIVIFAFLLNTGISFLGDYFVLTEDGIAWSSTADMAGAGTQKYVKGGDARRRLEEMAKSSEKVRTILDHADQYPGELTGGIPLLLQWDERWGYTVYGDNLIAINGCGPTALAMAAAGLTGDAGITPTRVARYAAEQGYYEGEAGTSWTLMTEGAAAFGVIGQEIGLSRETVFSELESGHPIICSMRPGDFTSTGHFIVLTGTEDGKIRVNDPNSRARSETLWEYARLEPQINNLWAYTTG